ncbi:MAG: hypothetical protein K8R41_01200, partial [Bacteroidales bacterium]|nr:hypothetical protein [Bacteroidales bacterium]
MTNSHRTNKPIIYLIISVIIYFGTLANIEFSGLRTEIIKGDGRGYYAYLPSIFIHHTLDFTKVYEFEKRKLALDYLGHFYIDNGDTKINKYYSGVALLLLPFFLIAYFLSLIFGFELSGYSLLFQYSVFFAGLFYCILGLWFTRKLLKLFNIPEKIIIFVIVLLLFGTNLFYYSFINPSHSHVYSFAMMAIFLYFVKKIFISYSIKNIYKAAIALGLIILIRPTNVLILLILPFLASDKATLIKTASKFFKFKKEFFISFFIVLSIFSIQFIINLIQSGNIFIWSYKGEGFNFLNPEFSNLLFSFRKGLFIYTPLTFLAFFALIPLIKKSYYSFFTLTGFFLILFYFLSAWWNWFYGDSFGMRSVIDYYPVFAIMLGILFYKFSSKFIRIPLITISVLFLILNLIQTYQYNNFIIHPDAMNKEKYLHVFLKTGDEYKNIFGGSVESRYGEIKERKIKNYFNDFENPSEDWMLFSVVEIGDTAFSGNKVTMLNSKVIYNSGIKIKVDSTLIKIKKPFIKTSLWKYDIEKNASLKSVFVVDIKTSTGEDYFYKTFRLTDIPTDSIKIWRQSKLEFKIPQLKSIDDIITFYIWNAEAKDFYIDDVEIGIFE